MPNALEKRIYELTDALRNQWQLGYEAALVELDIDPETHIQSTKNPIDPCSSQACHSPHMVEVAGL